jgi:hypothetical protein
MNWLFMFQLLLTLMMLMVVYKKFQVLCILVGLDGGGRVRRRRRGVGSRHRRGRPCAWCLWPGGRPTASPMVRVIRMACIEIYKARWGLNIVQTFDLETSSRVK